jgi:hypothetical protein
MVLELLFLLQTRLVNLQFVAERSARSGIVRILVSLAGMKARRLARWRIPCAHPRGMLWMEKQLDFERVAS